MKKEIIITNGAPAPIGPYSQAVIVGDIIYCSGQIPVDPKTNALVEANIETQTKQVFENIRNILTAAGSDFEKVIKTNVFLKDINDFEVDTVVTVDGVNKYRYSTEYIVYELMLKSVQAGDIISIPFDYYRKLKTFIKKGIWQSVDYTKYKCIAEIRLNPNIDDNLLCIVNYDESNEWVKIEVLRQFSIRKATDQEVAMFSIEIAKQQRMNK